MCIEAKKKINELLADNSAAIAQHSCHLEQKPSVFHGTVFDPRTILNNNLSVLHIAYLSELANLSCTPSLIQTKCCN